MNTQTLRSHILYLAIRGLLLPQNPNDQPAPQLLLSINPNAQPVNPQDKPFPIPNSWTWCRLGDISNYAECVNVTVDEIPDDGWVLELEDIEKDSAKVLQKLNKENRPINGVRHEFHKGDILYSKLRTYLNKVLVAPADGYCTTEIIPFNALGGISNDYICLVLRSPYFLGYTAQCGYGVKMPRLSATDARKAPIPLPPLPEQQRIASKIQQLFSTLSNIQSQL